MIQVVLITRTGKAYLANGIAAFTLDKEAYTPYSQLTATVYGNFSIQQFAGIYRVQLLLDGTELHFGTVEKFRLVQENGTLLVEDGSYSTPEKVAEYLHFYGHLPQNYLTKQEAKALGWAASQGNLWEVAEGKSIGGDRFGNREGLLPEADGRTWYECDVNYMGGFRGAERLLYSSDGLIYYTDDHYASFTLVYGEEETP